MLMWHKKNPQSITRCLPHIILYQHFRSKQSVAQLGFLFQSILKNCSYLIVLACSIYCFLYGWVLLMLKTMLLTSYCVFPNYLVFNKPPNYKSIVIVKNGVVLNCFISNPCPYITYTYIH